MKCKLALNDWRQRGTHGSIYNAPLGYQLSEGDLHSGTTFQADVRLQDKDAEREICAAWDKHYAYPLFALMHPQKDTPPAPRGGRLTENMLCQLEQLHGVGTIASLLAEIRELQWERDAAREEARQAKEAQT